MSAPDLPFTIEPAAAAQVDGTPAATAPVTATVARTADGFARTSGTAARVVFAPGLARALGVVLASALFVDLVLRLLGPGALASFGLPAWARGLVDLAVAVSALGLIATLAHRLGAARAALARAHERAAMIDGAIDTMHVGFAIWDTDNKLVAASQAFRRLYAPVAHLFARGADYVDLMRRYYAVGAPEVVGARTQEQFLHDLAVRRDGATSTEVVRHHGDRWLLSSNGRTGSGEMINIRVDVTEQHLFDIELRKRRKIVDDIGELTFDWFWRTDGEGRFVELSDSVEKVSGFSISYLLGKRREEQDGFEADPAALANYRRLIDERKPFPWFRFKIARGDGSTAWEAVTGKPIIDESGQFQGYYGAGRDVTERASMMDALRRSEERFRALTMLATDWYWETDAALRVTLLKGPDHVDGDVVPLVVGTTIDELIDRRDLRIDRRPLIEPTARRAAFRRVRFCLHDDANRRTTYFEISGEPIHRNDRFAGYRGLVWNVTEREALLEKVTASEARFRALSDLSTDWYWEIDESLRFSAVTPGKGSDLPSSLGTEAVIGKQRWELDVEIVQPPSWDDHKATLAARQPFRDLLTRRRDGSGQYAYYLASGDPIVDVDGTFRGYRGVTKDITSEISSRQHIDRLATVDALTQLPNRQSFDEQARLLLANAFAQSQKCALLFVDLDNFRLLNNGYGHRVGDQMLAIVASRLRSLIPPPHLLGRRGGDELVVLLVDVRRPNAAIEVAQELIRAIAEPARILGMEVAVTPSVGIAQFPQDATDLDALVNAADAAMYHAKDSGRRTYALFTPTVARRVDLRLRLEQRLRKAVESRDFRLFYQPLVSLADGKIVGAEALIRWKDAELGDISPSEFVPIAEESGLVVALGDWVLRDACRARQVWRQIGLEVPPIAINVSGLQLRQIGYVDGVLNVLAHYEVPASDIAIEVTETGLLEMSAVSRENLLRLRNAGIRIALDDFGVGYSSLSHLRDLPIQRLKIDRSFTVECMRDARTLTIVKAVVEMAKSLGIDVTAEGIETQAQQTWMQHLGCDSAQGYLFARPMSAEDFLRLFVDRRGSARERSLMH